MATPARRSASEKITNSKPKRAKVDWDAVERDYRTGKFTLRELAAKYKTIHQNVSHHIKNDGWTQDLSIAIRQATNVLLTQKLVADKSAKTGQELAKTGQELANTVQAAAEMNKSVILEHRNDIKSTRNVAADLLQELSQSALLAEHQDLLAEILAGPEAEPIDVAKARATVRRALEVHSRISSVKSLAETFSKLQLSERLAFAIESGAGQGEDDPMAKLFDLVNGSKLPLSQA